MIERGRERATYKFWVEAYGPLAKHCEKFVEAGRLARVVGHLRQDTKNPPEVHVRAEHIEFKPMAEKEEKDA